MLPCNLVVYVHYAALSILRPQGGRGLLQDRKMTLPQVIICTRCSVPKSVTAKRRNPAPLCSAIHMQVCFILSVTRS